MSTIKFKSLFFGGVITGSERSNNFEISYFLTALVVTVFHFVGSSISQFVLHSGLEKMEKRQIFYFMMFFMEFVGIVTLISLHKLIACNFSRITFYVCLLSVVMALLQMLEFVSRGIYDLDVFTSFYRYSVVLVNLSTLTLISAYPLFVFYKKAVKY
ncbi:MAG: hypothetical protein HRT38_01570 [Alteromonadaceae bacterium]|nr:hypothetical protein [Alteromonadaceae bacterium]